MLKTQFAAALTVVLCALGSAAHATFYIASDQSSFSFEESDVASVFSTLLDSDTTDEDSSYSGSRFARKALSTSARFESNIDAYSNYYSNTITGQSILQWWLRWQDDRGLASLLIDKQTDGGPIDSPAPVPVPAAALLFGSAMGLLFFPRARRFLQG